MDGTHFIIFTWLSLAGLFLLAEGQNLPPRWNQTSLEHLPKGVSEDTPIGTSLGRAQCIDPEGDPIRYGLSSGKAVQVRANGDVRLAVKLDFEQKDELGYDLTFICVDMNSEGFDLHNEVEFRTVISPNDANDNAPVFETSSREGYSFRISENANVGTVLAPPIRTRDNDRTVNAVLEKLYLICDPRFATPEQLRGVTESSNATCGKFKVDFRQMSEGVYVANISLTSRLDYEQRPTYSSKLIAVDGPNLAKKFTTTVNVQINVADAQDVGPIFTNPGASTTISEGVAIGVTTQFAISARDGDIGDRRPIKLTIINDTLDAFSLTPAIQESSNPGVYSSRLVVKNQLDRESLTSAYEFVIKATELDKVTREETTATATSTYSVFVSDVNDSPPRFANSIYSINVTEIPTQSPSDNTPVQITGLHITCVDPDEPSNAQYSVRVVEQSFQAYSISPAVEFFTGNGSMFLKVDNTSVLDYDVEAYRVQRVVLEAIERTDQPRFSSSTTISIYLTDINDNSPLFEDSSYAIKISENINNFPTEILRVKATDKDSGANGEIRYRFEAGVDSRFLIDPVSGAITLNGKVDFETTSAFIFLVYASDQANVPRSSQVQVTVNVENANDLGPVFRLPTYRTSANESSLKFLNPINVTATDNEVGTAGLTYRIVSGQSPNNAFAINRLTGELTLTRMLDYDQTPLLSNGERSGKFILVVEASDNGSPAQTSTVNVTVTVIDENNHGPVLNPTSYYAQISELAPPGTFVEQILGKDDDNGDFGTISYRIGAGLSDNFFIDRSSGNVTVGQSQSFDYNVQSLYTLQIIATDGGAPQKSATATVFVTILDGNNKNPTFGDSFFNEEVDEKTPVGDVALSAPASDVDSTASLVYYIERSSIKATNSDGTEVLSTSPYDYREAFGVRPNGDIFVKNTLNKDLAQEISFQLVVRDENTESGDGTGTTQITLIITGDPESGITFDPVPQVFMNEDSPVNYPTITVTARDPNNVPVSDYREISTSEFFDVSRDGVITLAKKIDYENDTPDHLHRVIVRAVSQDGTESATVTVTVSIVDVNDNAPVFQMETYKAQVSEIDEYPTRVVTIYATDKDSKSYGPLEYRIAGGLDSDDFTIFHDPVMPGSISARRAYVLVAEGKKLDFNRRQQYDLDIIVGDNRDLLYGSVRLFSSAKLIIDVVDVNNHIPKFKDRFRDVAVAETAEVGYGITTIIASDEDYGSNGQIIFSLESDGSAVGDEGVGLFSISPDRGRVSVSRSLREKGGRRYPLRVRAQDNGDVPNFNYMNLTIKVLSTQDDDGNPVWNFPPSEYTVYAPEETPNYVIRDGRNRTQFFDVSARQPNGSIVYSWGDSSNDFIMDRFTGVITIVASLDREKQETYTLLIFAGDTTDPNRYKTALLLNVKLTDKDDNSPTFLNPRNYGGCEETDRPLVIYVTENTPANTSVYTLRACDWDSPANSAIVYTPYNEEDYCRTGNKASLLEIQPDGTLVTTQVIDYEKDKEFKMCALASPARSTGVGRKKRAFDMDAINNIRDDVAYINVVILDENDNGPRFPSPEETRVIKTKPDAGPVITLNAVDPDGKENNLIIYRIVRTAFYPQGSSTATNPFGAFRIIGDKGSVHPALPSYQDYVGGHFTLRVSATDYKDNSLQVEQIVTIYVYEENQALKVTLNLEPAEGFSVGEELIERLDGVSDSYSFTYLQVAAHRNNDNERDTSKTDICFLAVDSNSNDILNVREMTDLLDKRSYRDVLDRDSYKQIDRGQCYPSQSSEEHIKWRDLWWILVAVGIFIFVCCLILIPLVLILYEKYKRYMETRKTYLVSQ